MRGALLSTMILLASALMTQADAAPDLAKGWNAQAAAHYLDARLTWWRQWPKSERDHGTRCISCHTSLPHVLSRPSLRAQFKDSRPAQSETAMFDDVIKRVWLWNDVEPFYPDQTRGVPKSSESRGTESVLNALILATRDQERGYLAPDTRQAFANMWALQLQRGDEKGGFAWLNFRLEPHESPSAVYWGATLAALAIARAPDGYAADAAVAPQVDALRTYLRTGITGQSLHSRTLLLWADSQLHGVLDASQRQKIIDDLISAQGKDGGWSLPSLSNWQRIDKSSLPDASDGYATALVALVLREAGMPTDTAPLRTARAWLASHQDKATGAVPAKSINKDRQPGTDAYFFMTDQATGLAALAMRPVK